MSHHAPNASPSCSACFAKPNPEVAWVWRPPWERSWATCSESDSGQFGHSLKHEAASFHTGRNETGGTRRPRVGGTRLVLLPLQGCHQGCESMQLWASAQPVRSHPNFLEPRLYPLAELFTPPEWDKHPLLILAPATTILATNVTQDSTLSTKHFALCLQALLRPFLALSPCEFATCMQVLKISPAHLSCYPPFPPWQHPAHLLLPSLRIIEYSHDALVVFLPRHLLKPETM